MNMRIRNAIYRYLEANVPTDSRFIITMFATLFKTTKQRISGNISFMVCKAKTISIIRSKPHSVLY